MALLLDTLTDPNLNTNYSLSNKYGQDLRGGASVTTVAGAAASETIGYKYFYRNKDENKVFGQCPVASEKTVCCNLMTIDAIQGCSLGCSYCSIQTF